jgi:hypothetical protein
VDAEIQQSFFIVLALGTMTMPKFAQFAILVTLSIL